MISGRGKNLRPCSVSCCHVLLTDITFPCTLSLLSTANTFLTACRYYHSVGYHQPREQLRAGTFSGTRLSSFSSSVRGRSVCTCPFTCACNSTICTLRSKGTPALKRRESSCMCNSIHKLPNDHYSKQKTDVDFNEKYSFIARTTAFIIVHSK